MFSDTNALYPGIFPGVRKFEAEIVSMVVRMLRGDAECCGALTSGGTESVLLMVKAYRCGTSPLACAPATSPVRPLRSDHAREHRGICEPEIIATSTAHSAIDKACEYFGVTLTRVPVTSDQR